MHLYTTLQSLARIVNIVVIARQHFIISVYDLHLYILRDSSTNQLPTAGNRVSEPSCIHTTEPDCTVIITEGYNELVPPNPFDLSFVMYV